VSASFTSIWNSDDAQKQDIETMSKLTDRSDDDLEAGKYYSVTEDSQGGLVNENFLHALGEAPVGDGQTNARTVTACTSLVVNGDARAKTTNSSSELHSKKVLSDDTVEAMQASLLHSVENLIKVVAVKNGRSRISIPHLYNGRVTQSDVVNSPAFNTGCANCNSSCQVEDGGSCLNDIEKLCGVKSCSVPCSEGNDGLDHSGDSESQNLCEHVAPIRNKDLAAQKTKVPIKGIETVANGLVSGVGDCESADVSTTCSGRREVSALDVYQGSLDSGDSVLVSANLRLLKVSQKPVSMSLGECRQNQDAGREDDISDPNSSEVHGPSSHGVESRDPVSAVNNLQNVSHEDADNTSPTADHDAADRHCIKRQLSALANNIQNLQAWVRSTNTEVRSIADDTANGPGSAALSVVERYAGELQQKKVELDQLNTEVKDLEESDKNLVFDERRRIVSVHSDLHDLSATLNTIASETVCDVERLLCIAYLLLFHTILAVG